MFKTTQYNCEITNKFFKLVNDIYKFTTDIGYSKYELTKIDYYNIKKELNFIYNEAIQLEKNKNSKYFLYLKKLYLKSIKFLSYSFFISTQRLINENYCDKFHIISLGTRCLSRTIPTRYGLKPTKKAGEKSCPFDLAIHPIQSIYYLLKNNFDGYFDNIEFNGKYFQNKKLNILFSHDTDIHFNQKDLLIKRYYERIINFYNYINSIKHKIYVISIGNWCNDLDICKTINLIYYHLYTITNTTFNFVVIDSRQNPLKIDDIDEKINYLYTPFPSIDYQNNWFIPEMYSLKSGIKFEYNIINYLKYI